MRKTAPSYHLSHRAAIGRHPEARSELSEAWQSVVGHGFHKNSARKVDAWEITDFGLRPTNSVRAVAHGFCMKEGAQNAPLGHSGSVSSAEN